MFEVGEQLNGRTICLKALVGSHNYNLNTPSSDKDYKYFVYPTLDDLYDAKMYHKEVVTETEDYTVHDIRKLPMLIWKANVNFLEIMYSKELSAIDGIDEYLIESREAFSLMNMKQMYSAALGMFMNKLNQTFKDSPGRHESYEKYGYDTKSACHAVRLLDFTERITNNLENHVSDPVQKAFYYEDSDKGRDYLLAIKRGEYPKKEIQFILDTLHEKFIVNENTDVKKYFQKEADHTLYESFKAHIKKLVFSNIGRSYFM